MTLEDMQEKSEELFTTFDRDGSGNIGMYVCIRVCMYACMYVCDRRKNLRNCLRLSIVMAQAM